jgi:hypothetical protein
MKRKWLTISEAVRYLAVAFGEDVTEADVLRYGLDGQLTLSVRFVNLAQAKRYVKITDAEYVEMQEEENARAAARAAGLPEPVFERRAPTPLEEECCRVVVLRDDVYDLPMVGQEKLDVEREYQQQTGGPKVALTASDGTFVDSEGGDRFQLQTADGPVKTDSLPYYLEPGVTPYPLREYSPARGLPGDSRLVVRTAALAAFMAQTRSLDSTEPTKNGEREQQGAVPRTADAQGPWNPTREAAEIAPPAPTSDPRAPFDYNAQDFLSKDGRRAAVIDFLDWCNRATATHVEQRHIWKAMRHRSPRSLQYWLAMSGRPKETKACDDNVRRILMMKPADFVTLLRERRLV